MTMSLFWEPVAMYTTEVEVCSRQLSSWQRSSGEDGGQGGGEGVGGCHAKELTNF